MNILEVCVVPDLGGLELYFHRCCVALKARGHHVISIRLSGSRLEELGKKDGVNIHALQRGNKLLPYHNAKEIARLIEENRIDIVHGHHRKDLPLLSLAKRLSKRPFKLVFTRQMPMKQKKKDVYHRLIYSRIDLFLTITDLLKRDATEKLPIPADRIHRLYYGVDPPPSRDQGFLDDFMSISKPGDFIIGVFSRLEFQKGQHLVIEALKIMIDNGIPAKLYLVGHVMDEDYKKTLADRIKEFGLENHTAFKGFIPKPVLAMQGLDALVLPSRNEAFGLVLVEAMRCGVTVLGVNAGGVPEIIDHEQTGLLFDWENAQQLATQLTNLYQNPGERKRLALNGKEKADKEFDSEVHFRKLETYFERIISHGLNH